LVIPFHTGPRLTFRCRGRASLANAWAPLSRLITSPRIVSRSSGVSLPSASIRSAYSSRVLLWVSISLYITGDVNDGSSVSLWPWRR
jgi:hypothetical protein